MSTILDLLHEKGIEMKRVAATHGGEYSGPCPMCGGRDRFRVWPEEGQQGKWWCRGCNKGGDLVQYFREVQGLSYQEACLEAGVEPTPMKKSFDWSGNKSKGGTWKPREIPSPPIEWIQKCSAFVNYAQEQLWKCPAILNYLQNKRGLNDSTIETMRIGWNPQNLSRERVLWGLPEKTKKDGSKQNIWLPRGIVIPYYSDGVLQRARVRRLDNQASGPPYCIVSGSTSAAMICPGPDEICIVVESEFDGILLHQEAGTLATVCALGSAQARPDSEAFEILSRAKLILVALDDDEAGTKQAQWWAHRFARARRLPPVEGKDPGEMWANGVDLQEWVQTGIDKYSSSSIREFRKKLEQIAIKKYTEIAEIYPEGCYSWIQQYRPDIASMGSSDEDYLNKIWDLCEAGKSSLDDFQSALSIWANGRIEMIEKYREGINAQLHRA